MSGIVRNTDMIAKAKREDRFAVVTATVIFGLAIATMAAFAL